MTDVLGKVIGIILIVVLLIIAPLNLISINNRGEYKLNALNTVQQFLDITSDSGRVSKDSLDELSRNLAATGMILSYEVSEYRILAEGDKVSLVKICDITYDRIEQNGGVYEIPAGGWIRVHFKEDVASSEASLWYRIIGSLDMFEDTLGAMRR